MRYRIEYSGGRCCKVADSSKDLIEWLRLLKDESISLEKIKVYARGRRLVTASYSIVFMLILVENLNLQFLMWYHFLTQCTNSVDTYGMIKYNVHTKHYLFLYSHVSDVFHGADTSACRGSFRISLRCCISFRCAGVSGSGKCVLCRRSKRKR